MCYGQGHAQQGCYQLSLTAAPGKNSSPTGTQDTPVGEEDAGPSREINKRQKETGGNDMSWIKEDSKLTPLKRKLRCSRICQYLQGHHWDCLNRMLSPGGTAWNQYANQAPSGTKSSTQDYAVWSQSRLFSTRESFLLGAGGCSMPPPGAPLTPPMHGGMITQLLTPGACMLQRT